MKNTYKVSAKGTYLCHPFPEGTQQAEVRGGLAFSAKHKVVLLEAYGGVHGRTRVAVRATDSATNWGRDVFEDEDGRFIVVPENRVLYCQHEVDASEEVERSPDV